MSAAKLAQADRYAPYEYTAAEEYLHKAREEGGHAEYQDAIEYGRRSEELAEPGPRHRRGEAGAAAHEVDHGDARPPSTKSPSRADNGPSPSEAPIPSRSTAAARAASSRVRVPSVRLAPSPGAPVWRAGWRRLRGHAARVERARGARDRQGGARPRRLQCAPRELALAETHVEFAAHELDQGDYFRARDHVHIADRNAREALPTCRPASATCRPTPGDRDERRHPRQRRQVPGRARGQGRLRGRGRLPRSRQRQGRHPRRDDKCPNEPEDKDGFEDEDGCPDPDNDTDGIPDATDKCPNEPEDKDGFEDEDGCPDPDNDKDGVPDADDKCPNDPGPPDNDGCPKKYEHIVVTQEKIELKQKIFFDTDKATIQPRSFALLDEIGSVLRSRPTMTVRIEGHTDSRGTKAHNHEAVRGPCGVRAATSSGAGHRPGAHGGPRVWSRSAHRDQQDGCGAGEEPARRVHHYAAITRLKPRHDST